MQVTPSPEPVVLYSRYSSNMQDDNSLAYQMSAAEAYCRSHNMEIVETYSDAAYTGTTDRRPNFQRMMTDARNHPEWNKILVYKLSRLFRNANAQAQYEAELKKLGIICVSITESFPDTPLGRHERRVQASHNQLVSEETGEHTFSGQLEKARQGLHCGGRPPLGYRIENQRLVVDEDQAETVRIIFDMYLSGDSYRAIAARLNSEGRSTQEGRRFTKNSFNSILQQEKYCGVYVWNKATAKSDDGSRNSHKQKPETEQVRIPDGCPAIIDRDTFDRVQEEMRKRKGGNRRRYHYMLSSLGVLKCADCGHTLEGRACTTHKGEKYTVYSCPNHHGGNRNCPTKDIRTEYLDEAVARALVYHRFQRADLSALSAVLSADDEVARLKKRQKELTTAINCDLRLLERSSSDAAEARYFENTEELKRVTDLLSSLQTAGPLITEENYSEVFSKFKRYLKSSNDPSVRKFLLAHIRGIYYGNRSTKIILDTARTEKVS